jgi:hypothetical protein
MLIEKECIALKKRKEDFLLLTASTVIMDPRVLTTHNFYKDMILDEIDAKMAVESAPALASASVAICDHSCDGIGDGIGQHSRDGIRQYSSDGISGRS